MSQSPPLARALIIIEGLAEMAILDQANYSFFFLTK